jgi:hypothetical protein
MFGRFNEVEDKPDWRERLAEWRNSPVWVPQRPEWLGESPRALLLMFAGLVCATLSVVYLVVPADALPSVVPGRWVAPVTTSTTSTTTTTTTTLPAEKKRANFAKIAALPKSDRAAAWQYLERMADQRAEQQAVDTIVNSPAVPPSRRWAFAFLAAVAAVLLLAAAWLTSDRRGRIMFEK